MSLHSVNLLNMSGFDAFAQSVAVKLNCDASLVGIVQQEAVLAVGYSGDRCAMPIRSFTARDTICGRALRKGKPLRIVDVAADADLCDLPMVRALNIGAYLGVPLVIEGVGVVGSLCALSAAPRIWRDREFAYLVAMGEMVVGRIERDRLAQEQSALSAALAETDQILTLLARSLGQAVTVHNASGEIVFANAALRTQLRLGETDLVDLAVVSMGLDLGRVGSDVQRVTLPGAVGIVLDMRIAAHANGLVLVEWFAAT